MIFNPNVMAAAGGGAIIGTPTKSNGNLIIDVGVELAAVIVADTQGFRTYLATNGISKAPIIPGSSSVPYSMTNVSWSGTTVTIAAGSVISSYEWVFVAIPKA